MKPINQIVATMGGELSTEEKREISVERKKAIVDQIDKIFTRLVAIYGYTPKAADLSEMKKVWFTVLSESTIRSSKQIERGIKRAMLDENHYFPKAAIFVKWCLESPESENLPSLNESYLECRKNAHAPKKADWSHIISYWSGYGMWHHLKETVKDTPNSQFKSQYTKAIEQFNAGTLPPIPQHEQVIEDQAGKAVTPEEKAELKEVGNETIKNLLKKVDGKK